MTTKWQFTRQTKAPIPKVIEYFAHPENLPKIHSDFVKEVTIKNTEGDTINFEQQMQLMSRNIVSQNKMTINRQENNVIVDTIDGDGKGSKVTMTFKQIANGATEINYDAAMELGPLGFFAKGPAKSAMQKVADEDAKNLDAL